MAKTIQQWYDAIIAEKNSMIELQNLQPNIDNNQTLLQDVASPSKVADWRLWVWIWAVFAFIFEGILEINKKEVSSIVEEKEVGTLSWYQKKALEFQYGYQLIWLNNKFQYSLIDDGAKIIKRAAATEVSGQVTLKVAGISGGNLVPLNSLQLDAFRAYMNKVRFAGTDLIVISRNADLIKCLYEIYYDPLVLAPDGSLLSNPSIFPVNDAINNYLANLEFDGEFIIEKMEDLIQAAIGVIKFNPITVERKYGLIPYAPVIVSFISDAGYITIDPLNPLSSTINYIPSV